MSNAEIELMTALRRELEIARATLERERERADRAEANAGKAQKALRWYLAEDRRAADDGLIKTVAMRPAFHALGGRPSGVCSRHRESSADCLVCYPSPPRPRVAVARA